MENIKLKGGRKNEKNTQQNTIPMITRNKSDKVQQKNNEKKNSITVKKVSNSYCKNDTFSSEESFIAQRSQNCTPTRKSKAHSIDELNSSEEIEAQEQSKSMLVDDSTENILFQKYFHILPETEDEKKNVTAKCVACARDKPNSHCRSSKAATSNFVRHLRVMFVHIKIKLENDFY